MRSKSFADLAETLGRSHRPPQEADGSRAEQPVRPLSTVDLHRYSTLTRHRRAPEHLPTDLIVRILSYSDDSTLSACLTVSRLLFNLAGTMLYRSVTLKDTVTIWRLLDGATGLVEGFTGKIAVGRRRFKDRLLRHTTEVTLYSHGDDDDDGVEISGAGSNGAKSLSLSSTKLGIDSDIESYSNHPSIGECPPVSLRRVTPRLKTLRVVLADAFDYHTLFCTRYDTCKLLGCLDIERMVVVGARSPLLVLPSAFPAASEYEVPPRLTVPPIRLGGSNLTPRLLDTAPDHFVHRLGHPFSNSTPHGKTASLPPKLQELTIVLPSGRSYDAEDYQRHHHIFHHRNAVNCLTRLTIVFLSPPPPASRPSDPRPPWQIAYYDSRTGNSNWTSYLNLAEDLAIAALAVPLDTAVDFVGLEGLDGELLNMGVGVSGDARVGQVMEARVRSRIEVRLKSADRGCETERMTKTIRFVKLEDWLDRDGAQELAGIEL
ncbi:hypothetical protein IAU60_001608 [Kwoniella sp. DSM 27419]